MTAGALPVLGTDLVAFAVTVLPVFISFTVAESRRGQASLGTSYTTSLLLVVLTVGMVLLDPNRRTLRDRVAGTRVISVQTGQL